MASLGTEIWSLKYPGDLDFETIKEVIRLKDEALKERGHGKDVRGGEIRLDENGIWAAEFTDHSGETHTVSIGHLPAETQELKEELKAAAGRDMSTLSPGQKKALAVNIYIPSLTVSGVEEAVVGIERLGIKTDIEGLRGLLADRFPQADGETIKKISEKALSDYNIFENAIKKRDTRAIFQQPRQAFSGRI